LVDATVLSNLASVNRLDLLDLLQDSIYVASAVYEEVQRGIEEGYEFLTSVDLALTDACLLLTTLEGEREWQLYQSVPVKLHRGEAMSLAIASCRQWRTLTDDRAARSYAKRLDVPTSGTLGLLCYAVRSRRLALEEANTLLAEMIARARYRSPVTDLQDILNR
jgi:predicted nucleic acid-binding protein